MTDLRGSGLLGLRQLHSFCLQNKNTALPIFKNSTAQDTFHFFCVTGINITQKLVNSLKGETNSKTALATDELINLDKHLLEHVDKLKTDADYVKVMGLLYKTCFIEFDKAWCARAPCNIMNFTQDLNDIFTTKFDKAIPMALQ